MSITLTQPTLCEPVHLSQTDSNEAGRLVARPGIPLGHCGGSFGLPRVPDRAGAIVALPVSSARVVLPGRLKDELSAVGSAQPNLGLRRWDDPSGLVGTEPGPTVSSFVGRASHSLPNS